MAVAPHRDDLIIRHGSVTRIWHWINAVLMLGLLMSGLAIFNAHLRLYWGDAGNRHEAAWFEIGAEETRGFLRFGDAEITTTGALGYSEDPYGNDRPRAFPTWATLPDTGGLAVARRWHFGFGWPFVVGTVLFALYSFLTGRVHRTLLPRLEDLRPAQLWHHCKRHFMLRLPTGAAAREYNVLQKLAYLCVTGILLPLIILTGFCMSPAMNAAMPWLPELFGGRQSARSLHFIVAWGFVLFVLIHVAMILVAGPINEMRSMVTGWFRLPGESKK